LQNWLTVNNGRTIISLRYRVHISTRRKGE
jgi:hypothetical protein